MTKRGLALLIIGAGLFIGLIVKLDAPSTVRVTLAGTDFSLEVADSADEHALGLGGRKSLARRSGMLFMFKEAGKHSFWMKDMHFPIDIVWLNESSEVVHFEVGVSPETFPQTFEPEKDAVFVIEVNAGELEHVRLGERAVIEGL